MKVLHTVQGLGARLGGLSGCTSELLSALQNGEDTFELLTLAQTDGDKSLGEGAIWYKPVENDGLTSFNFSRNAARQLRHSQYDIYHIHGLWQHIGHLACHTARHNRKPYVISPHGMLYPAALKVSYRKKLPLLKLWFERDIMEAACLIATCDEEQEHIRRFGYTGPIAKLSNPVNIPSVTGQLLARRRETIDTEPTGRRRIGFLGRLHHIKRLDLLLQGLALSRHRDDIELVIMGEGDETYMRSLRDLITHLKLDGNVVFKGFVSGDDKYRQLARLSALFVTSDTENFGAIVPEALLVGIPVFASINTPWHDLEKYNCGWWRSNSPESIAEVIDSLFTLSPSELLEMGARGRTLIVRQYESSTVASGMRLLYNWIVGKADKPGFVDTLIR